MELSCFHSWPTWLILPISTLRNCLLKRKPDERGKSDPHAKSVWYSGYVEWEKYPEKKAIASHFLNTMKFTPIPVFQGIHLYLINVEFQHIPLPKTNPISIGHRWKEYHEAFGLKSIVDFSWDVQKEKRDSIYVWSWGVSLSFLHYINIGLSWSLDFPLNAETRWETGWYWDKPFSGPSLCDELFASHQTVKR